jgi:hypothetical protein
MYRYISSKFQEYSASLPCNVLSHEGSETGSEAGVGAETSLKVGSGSAQDPKKIIPDPQPCLEDYHSGSDSAKVWNPDLKLSPDPQFW